MKSNLSKDLRSSEAQRLRGRLGRLIEDVLGPEITDVWEGMDWSPELEVCEEEDSFAVCAEIPGVAPDDLEVSISGRTLTIRGEKREERAGARRSERVYGSFRRTIALPEEVDPDSAESAYDQGVLTIRFDRKPAERSAEKRIPVGAAGAGGGSRPREAKGGGGAARTLKEAMTRTVECVKPDDPVQDIAARMKNLDLGSFPVCDDQGRVVGMITDRDLVLRVMAEGRDPWTARVRDVMTREVATVGEEESVESAEELMKERQIRRIPVVDREHRLTGYFSIGRLARTGNASDSREVLKRVTEPPKSKTG